MHPVCERTSAPSSSTCPGTDWSIPVPTAKGAPRKPGVGAPGAGELRSRGFAQDRTGCRSLGSGFRGSCPSGCPRCHRPLLPSPRLCAPRAAPLPAPPLLPFPTLAPSTRPSPRERVPFSPRPDVAPSRHALPRLVLRRAWRGLAPRLRKSRPSDRRPMGGGGGGRCRRRKRPRDEATSRRRVSSSCRGAAGRTVGPARPAMAESDWDTVTVLRKKGPTAAQAKSKQVRAPRASPDPEAAGRTGQSGRGGRDQGIWAWAWGGTEEEDGARETAGLGLAAADAG